MNKKYIDVVRIKMVKERRTTHEIAKFNSSAEAGKILSDFLADWDRECMAVLMLDIKNRICSINSVSMGSLDCTIFHPREVFKTAILANAKSIIVAHNHPSGDLVPSSEDVQITRKLAKAGAILGIAVLDHIIVGPVDEGKESYFSFEEQGILAEIW